MCTHSAGQVETPSQHLFALYTMPPYSTLPNLHHQPIGGNFIDKEIEVQSGEVMGLERQNLNSCSGRR